MATQNPIAHKPTVETGTVSVLVEATSIGSLQQIDHELQEVLCSLTPSLEALADLTPDDQVGNFKSLISELKTKATKLSDENVRIKELVERFNGSFGSPLDGIEGASYASFLYENKILGERLKRILDPNCNKMIQCGIIDENLCKETQTNPMNEVLKGYLREKDAERQKDLLQAKTLQPGQFVPGGDDVRECGCEIVQDPLADTPLVKIMFIVTLICLAFAFAGTATLAALNLFYT